MPRVTKKPRQQPHTFPEQMRPSRRKYRVTGDRRIGEVEPGGVVELALTDGQERVLLEAGLIKPYTREPDVKSSPGNWPVAPKQNATRPIKADTEKE